VTMDDIKAMKEDWITPATAASAMKMNTGRLIEYAKKGQLPFPVQISGSRVKIGRKGFLAAYGYKAEEEKKPDIGEKLDRLIEEVHSVVIALTLMANPEQLMRIIEQIELSKGGLGFEIQDNPHHDGQ